MEHGFSEQIEREGYGIVERVFSQHEVQGITSALGKLDVPRNRAGIRHLMKRTEVSQIAHSVPLRSLAISVLGHEAFPFRATYFDKWPTSNWLVAWHQDTALPLRDKRETPGWGPWSTKDGVVYAHAPEHALRHVLALRVHLDASNSDNGPLKVLPGTHTRGVLTDEEIHDLSEEIVPSECLVGAGGIVAMRPLVVHASSKCVSSESRRVLHIEYVAFPSFDDALTLAIA